MIADKNKTSTSQFVTLFAPLRLCAFALNLRRAIRRKGAKAQRRIEKSQVAASSVFVSFPGSAWERTALQAPPAVARHAEQMAALCTPQARQSLTSARSQAGAWERAVSNRSSSRRGYSLVEMLATMVVAAAVLTVVTCWLVSLLRGESAGRDHLLYAQTQDHLARQFRHDVHAALEVRPPAGDDAAQLLTLELAGGTVVEYRLDGNLLNRLERSGAEVRRRESYRLPPPGRARVELEPADEPTLASLLIDQRAVETKQPNGNTLRIDARCGLHQRLAAREAP
jgi:prepilin-type N-terminal cleavage/methylation domain-containing protein